MIDKVAVIKDNARAANDTGSPEVQVALPAGTIIVSPLDAAVIQAEISVLLGFAAVHVGLEPEQPDVTFVTFVTSMVALRAAAAIGAALSPPPPPHVQRTRHKKATSCNLKNLA